MRYFGPLSLEARTAHQRLVQVCFSDYDRELALVAVHGKGAARKVIAVGRLNRLHGCNDAEFAVLVSDAWQGRGLGTHLLEALVRIGRAEKMSRITGTVLAANLAMLDLCRRLGFQLKRDPGDDIVTADLTL